jgi:RNA recognition motif-containing protein
MELHINNFHHTIKETDLRELFAEHGEVSSVKIIRDRFTSQSKGFGFVTMPNPEEALQAIESLHNYQIGLRMISVTKASPRNSYLIM